MGNVNPLCIPSEDHFAALGQDYERLRAAGMTPKEIRKIWARRYNFIHDKVEQEALILAKKDDEYKKFLDSRGPPLLNYSYICLPHSELALHTAINCIEVGINKVIKQMLYHYNSQKKTADENEFIRGQCLIIDDNFGSLISFESILTNLNFKVLSSTNSKKGLELLLEESKSIDLVFLNLSLKSSDGLECLEWIRSHPDVSFHPVYIYSDLKDPRLIQESVNRGADGYLFNPIKVDDIIDIIDEYNLDLIKNPFHNHNIISSIGHMYNDYNQNAKSNSIIKDNLLFKSLENESNRNKLKKRTRSKIKISYNIKVPAFQGYDHDFKHFQYPLKNTSNKKYLMVLFIPSIFYTVLYSKPNGFLYEFMKYYNRILSLKIIEVICVCSDLPFSLSTAKAKFNIPFKLISDPNNVISRQFIGVNNMAGMLATKQYLEKLKATMGDNTLDDNEEYMINHKQNNFSGSNIGIYLLNNRRNIIKYWEKLNNFNLSENNFPLDFSDWFNLLDTSKSTQDIYNSSCLTITSEEIESNKAKFIDSVESLLIAKNSVYLPSLNVSSLEYSNLAKLRKKQIEENQNVPIKILRTAVIVDTSSLSRKVLSSQLKNVGFQVFAFSTLLESLPIIFALRRGEFNNPPNQFNKNKTKYYNQLNETIFFASHNIHPPYQYELSIVICELALPLCDGFELIRKIREEPSYEEDDKEKVDELSISRSIDLNSVKYDEANLFKGLAVVLTIHEDFYDEYYKEKCLKMGGQDLLVKPVNLSHITPYLTGINKK